MTESVQEYLREEPVIAQPAKAGRKFAYRVVMFIWLLFLFEPARMIAHYAPSLNPLKWIPSALILGSVLFWIMSQKKRVDRPFAAVVALLLVGTVVAFFDGNWGIAREVDRQIIQFFILSMITLTFMNTEERIRTLFKFFFWYFIFFAVWGVVGLKLTPIEAGSDPGMRAIVPWHPWLDNRDGFGPLMVIGMAFSFYLIQAVGSWKAKTAAFLGMWLCLIGIVMSFGRGVFLAMLATTVFIWLQMKQKLIGAVVIGAVVLLGTAAVMIVSPGDLYWEKMGTIESSMSEGTGADRLVLWGWAWREFLDNPIFGVGTGNYGIYLPRLISEMELLRSGYSISRVWGRSLHSAPFTILSEYGLLGVIVFSWLIIDFIRTNRRTAKFLSSGQKPDEPGQKPLIDYTKINSAIMACFIAFWANGVFYEILYSSFLWHILILNRLLFIYRSELVSGPADAGSGAGD